MTRLKDLFEYLDYLDNCSDGQFLKFVDAMEKRGYKFVTQYVHDYDYPYVTHCKDCKYYREDGDCWREWDNDGRIYYQSVIDNPNPDDYCSRAERKEHGKV